jgi:dihydroxyacetone kinase-like protein
MSISREAVFAWLQAYADVITANKDYLTELDSAIGDADHGANMQRGMQAVVAKLSTLADKDLGTVFKMVGMTLVSTVGGASGPLYGTLFMQMGASVAGKQTLTAAEWTDALEAGINGVAARGKAVAGEKTMLDALIPALDALKDVGDMPLADALAHAAKAAEAGRDATTPLVARKGRASYLGERSAGHQDPGATSAHLLLKTAAETLAQGA